MQAIDQSTQMHTHHCPPPPCPSRSQADDLRAKISELEVELQRERAQIKDLGMYKRRLDECTRDTLKLERALEMKVCSHMMGCGRWR